MYSRYFGLREKPFAISPDPRYLYMSESHREALAHLIYGIESDGCLVLLTGEVGTGKTTVCRCLLDQLPDTTDVALVFNPLLNAEELLKTICEELEIEVREGTPSIKLYVDRLNRYLLDSHSRGRSTALIIDEAQNLTAEVLEQLRLLTNLETNTHKLLRIILIGQPELRVMLERDELSQVNQRVTSRYHLAALAPDDIRNYIGHRLEVAGASNTALFSEKALRYVAQRTKGIPRLINLLCDRALLGAYAENSDHVSGEIMKQAGQEIFPGPATPATHNRRWRRVALAAMAIMAGLYTLWQLAPFSAVQPSPEQATVSPSAPMPQPEETREETGSQATAEKNEKQVTIKIGKPVRLSSKAELFGRDSTSGTL